jgi:hypothetical protein
MRGRDISETIVVKLNRFFEGVVISGHASGDDCLAFSLKARTRSKTLSSSGCASRKPVGIVLRCAVAHRK